VPVQRFRSIEEMNSAPILRSDGHAFERFLRHCARYRAIWPRTYPRGVFKFRGIEEAQAARAQVTRQAGSKEKISGPASGAGSPT
jgi:hypothetical protein